jgi:hypothetical protein
MPRAKPPEPLVSRSVRLSATNWRKFDKLGGAEWLRHITTRSYNNMVTPDKILRNRNVRIDRVAGMPLKDIAVKHRISERTVIRILK